MNRVSTRDDAMRQSGRQASPRTEAQRHESLEACRAAIRQDPGNATAYVALGDALSDDGQLDASIGAYREAVRRDPRHANAHNTLGVALSARGLVDAAIVEYRTRSISISRWLVRTSIWATRFANGTIRGRL